jgi:predicted secreted protein
MLFSNQEVLKFISSEFVCELTNQIGGSRKERFNFEAKKKGKTTIKLVYKRTWEDQPMKSKEYLVNII